MNTKTCICLVLLGLFASGCASSSQTEEVQVQTLVKSCHSWDGTPLPEYPRGQPEITILRIQIPPHTTLPVHEHPVINMGVLLKGELTVITESGKTLHLKAGDPIVEVVHTWHYGRNNGDVPAEIIVVYAGTKGEPITIKEQESKQAHRH